MSHKNAPTVNTGGEMGQILDHLLCASDPRIRMDDAREALRLDAALRAENERLRTALREIDDKIGHFAKVEVTEFPHVLIPLVARIAAEALAPPSAGEKEKSRG